MIGDRPCGDTEPHDVHRYGIDYAGMGSTVEWCPGVPKTEPAHECTAACTDSFHPKTPPDNEWGRNPPGWTPSP